MSLLENLIPSSGQCTRKCPERVQVSSYMTERNHGYTGLVCFFLSPNPLNTLQDTSFVPTRIKLTQDADRDLFCPRQSAMINASVAIHTLVAGSNEFILLPFIETEAMTLRSEPKTYSISGHGTNQHQNRPGYR